MKVDKEFQDYLDAIPHWLKLVSEISRLKEDITRRESGTPKLPNAEEIRVTYQERGWIAFTLPSEVSAMLAGYFDPQLAIPFMATDFSRSYFNGVVSGDTIALLSESMIYYSAPAPSVAASLAQIIRAMRKNIEAAIGPFSVVNVRAWNTKRTANAYGPTALHTDGISEHVRKIMIYPIPPNIENGTLEIVGRDGKSTVLNSSTNAAAVLADVGVLKHRGLPPQSISLRPAIEVTLIPALNSNVNADYFGQNARIPFPTAYDFAEVSAFYARLAEHLYVKTIGTYGAPFSEPNVNIGGGRRFDYPEWVNFDATSPNAAARLTFGPNTKLPYPDSHAKCVYSSHCMEHLQDETVLQLLGEAWRILRSDGQLVIKLPNFEQALSDWKDGISTGILRPELWNVSKLVGMWENHGIPESLDSTAAMIFCGFWNAAYGDHFSGAHSPTAEGAYHGPPRIPGWKMNQILHSSDSPHFVASLLRSEVLRSEHAPKFNHQNAWSYREFESTAAACGFELIECSDVCRAFRHIPDIEMMRDISQYYVFRKTHA